LRLFERGKFNQKFLDLSPPTLAVVLIFLLNVAESFRDFNYFGLVGVI
jgi:hypothetical protein